MATVLGANAYWPPSSSSANAPNRPMQPSEMGQLNGSVTSNSSASSLTAFNFDDSGVGTEDHTAAVGFENGNSPHFYAPYQLQQLPHLNTIYQQPLYAPHMPFSNENSVGNNNTALFKDLDGSSKNY